jgi:PAS domain S-box-containing protein
VGYFYIFHILFLNAVAFFVGQQVEGQRRARQRAEDAAIALTASEVKYRGLFESSPIAILLLDPQGAILDANPAAGLLFGKDVETLKSMAAADLIGTESEQRLLAPSQKGKWRKAPLTLSRRDGSEVYLEPTYTQVGDNQINTTIQVLLRDVTQERHRQAGLKAYAAFVLRGQEEERQRMARELHDETIQTLALLCRRLDSVESTRESLSFASALRPPILDDLGIVTSIRRLILDFAERNGIKAQLEVVGEEQRLPRDAEIGLFRIAQEALWNVKHHSRATEMVVTITFAEYEASLNIRDNGMGFSVPPVLGALSASGRLGLLGMQERAELLGGALTVESHPGKGTAVTVSIPIPISKDTSRV